MVTKSGILDLINSIAIFQLVFFGIYLLLKGNKIASTFFLKLHLFFQLISYINYFFWTREWHVIRPLLPLSMSGAFLWAPTFYFYIRSRLFLNFVPAWKLWVHAIPAILSSAIVIYILFQRENFIDLIHSFGKATFYISKIQQFIYYAYTLYIIHKYQHDLEYITSASEKDKLAWLYLISYGITLTTLVSFILYFVPGLYDLGTSYVTFLIFLNIFFFKAILQPDQYLGIDEKKLSPVKLTHDKSINHFKKIEELIAGTQIYLDPDLSLHNVAQAVKLSDRILSQVIKQNVQMNFSDYINLKRINYAKEVLRNTTKSEKNVLEILYEAGFNSKSVFNTQFKKHTGTSPTLYRESARN
jgi:AraC-like DNA-binding protein